MLAHRSFMHPALSILLARAVHRIVHHGGMENRFTSFFSPIFLLAIQPSHVIEQTNTHRLSLSHACRLSYFCPAALDNKRR